MATAEVDLFNSEVINDEVRQQRRKGRKVTATVRSALTLSTLCSTCVASFSSASASCARSVLSSWGFLVLSSCKVLPIHENEVCRATFYD
jgi:hypothetical protein